MILTDSTTYIQSIIISSDLISFIHAKDTHRQLRLRVNTMETPDGNF